MPSLSTATCPMSSGFATSLGPSAQATRHSSYTCRLVGRYLASGMEPAGRLVVISCRAGIESVAGTPKATGTCYERRKL